LQHSPNILEFDDNQKLQLLIGPEDEYLKLIEHRLSVQLSLRGNVITVIGDEPEVTFAKTVLTYLYSQLSRLTEISLDDVETALKMATTMLNVEPPQATTGPSIHTKRRIVFPRSENQARYIEAMQKQELVFGIGPAGTGKTYLAMAMGISLLMSGKVDRIILTRPAVEAGEKLGFLPGDMKEKVDPYLRPLYDALYELMSPEQITRRLTNNEIEVAPLAFMRGRTLGNAFVIVDEAQNTTIMQMKMVLTRLGPHSRMVVNGDITQIDLPSGVKSGLKDAMQILNSVPEIGFVYFNENDVARHHLVSKIVHAYQVQL
jgi:phosphate starvation-inducible PhoH-like protein